MSRQVAERLARSIQFKISVGSSRNPSIVHHRADLRQRDALKRTTSAILCRTMARINRPTPLIFALQQLSAQCSECDDASLHFNLRRHLGDHRFLESKSADVQMALRFDRKQR